MISVLVVDDQALVRGGFRMILDTEPDIEVCGEAEDGAVAVSTAIVQEAGRRAHANVHEHDIWFLDDRGAHRDRPSSASPHTSMSGSVSRIIRKPPRTSA